MFPALLNSDHENLGSDFSEVKFGLGPDWNGRRRMTISAERYIHEYTYIKVYKHACICTDMHPYTQT